MRLCAVLLLLSKQIDHCSLSQCEQRSVVEPAFSLALSESVWLYMFVVVGPDIECGAKRADDAASFKFLFAYHFCFV